MQECFRTTNHCKVKQMRFGSRWKRLTKNVSRLRKKWNFPRSRKRVWKRKFRAGRQNWRRRGSSRRKRTVSAMRYIHRRLHCTRRKSLSGRISSVFTVRKHISVRKRRIFRRICQVPDRMWRKKKPRFRRFRNPFFMRSRQKQIPKKN